MKTCFHLSRVLFGMVIYALRKRTPNFAYQSMILLFCYTSGRSSDLISRIIGFFSKKCEFSFQSYLLPDIRSDSYRFSVLNNIRKNGYHVFEKKLPADICDKLCNFALTTPSILRTMDEQLSGEKKMGIYDRDHPKSVRYEFETQDIINNSEIQDILADEAFAIIAQDYLDALPQLDVMGLWWHTALKDQPDREAAQFYHFDMDRFKWIKIFIYLTDVTTDNGPHSFVSGSHQTGGIPEAILNKGYARITDEEIKENYPESAIIEFVAPRGTIIMEDTRGLHKGKHVANGDRLILQLQFSNSLFGTNYTKTRFEKNLSEKLSASIKKYPTIYKPYL